MTLFRPCIDLHDGRVKQIVGGTLSDAGAVTHFVADEAPDAFSRRYRGDELRGGHVIQLGPGNAEAAKAALNEWPGGLQLGGGVNPSNARQWLEQGARQVIVTSWLFDGGRLSVERLKALSEVVGRDELVIDLSCRRQGDGWKVATNRWQTVTETEISSETFKLLEGYCSEFLVHAADVEGLCQGIDESLVEHLGNVCTLPCTYAGGAKEIGDLDRVERLSRGRLDLTFGSSLDLFGGSTVLYEDCVRFNRSRGA